MESINTVYLHFCWDLATEMYPLKCTQQHLILTTDSQPVNACLEWVAEMESQEMESPEMEWEGLFFVRLFVHDRRVMTH